MHSAQISKASDPTRQHFDSAIGVFPATGIGMRRFGVVESDLAIDFSGNNTSVLVTRLLEQCALDPQGHMSHGYFRDLSVGRRLECLLALAAGGARSGFQFPFHCAGCEQEIELELTLEDISSQQRQSDLIEAIDVKWQGRAFRFRKPTGRDQEKWVAKAFRDEREVTTAMIESLTLNHDLWTGIDDEMVDRIDEAMHEADPLVNFHCHVTCSECRAPNHLVIDLCDVALSALRRLQQQLIVTVHQLATHYHWSEKEIFAVPPFRRQAYLDLIAVGR